MTTRTKNAYTCADLDFHLEGRCVPTAASIPALREKDLFVCPRCGERFEEKDSHCMALGHRACFKRLRDTPSGAGEPQA